MITANGPNYADRQCKVRVPSISTTAEPYVLPDTPSVLSVGQKCMEEGFDFVWRANCRPYLRDSNGNKVYMDVRDNVSLSQVLERKCCSSCEGLQRAHCACTASRKARQGYRRV